MKPYLIVPFILEQPTWGGTYIINKKHWNGLFEFKNKKIGQSYELYGDSLLSRKSSPLEDGFVDTDTFSLSSLIEKDLSSTLGPYVAKTYGKMPLLIKLNQALGNSFQLHLKPGQTHPRWKAKPESWYFLEDGYISCGIKKDISLGQYKQCCVNIAEKMRELSHHVQNGLISLEDARLEAKTFITSANPWQYVNLYEMKKNDLLDLSRGGVHHSWEEHKEKYPLGNIVYEVQLDVMDEFCTIRSFDQGKIKEDGTIREIHIDDYFQFLDSSDEANDIKNLTRTGEGEHLLRTSYYSLDRLQLQSPVKQAVKDSFEHLFVQSGEIKVSTHEVTLTVPEGHSCFIPYEAKEYLITPTPEAIVLKTYISHN